VAEIVDPAHPLYRKRLPLVSVSRGPQLTANVFLRLDDGVVIKVPHCATSLSTLVQYSPCAKLSADAAETFLGLAKEYQCCPPTNSKPNKFGNRSMSKRGKKS
jgi:hypothetical protein